MVGGAESQPQWLMVNLQLPFIAAEVSLVGGSVPVEQPQPLYPPLPPEKEHYPTRGGDGEGIDLHPHRTGENVS